MFWDSGEIKVRCQQCRVETTIELILLHNSSVGDQLVCPKCSSLTFVIVRPVKRVGDIHDMAAAQKGLQGLESITTLIKDLLTKAGEHEQSIAGTTTNGKCTLATERRESGPAKSDAIISGEDRKVHGPRCGDIHHGHESW